MPIVTKKELEEKENIGIEEKKNYTSMKEIFVLRRQYPKNMQVIKGIRTNAWTEEEKEVEIGYILKKGYDNKFWMYIIEGAVTGYESASVDDIINRGRGNGWLACAGTQRLWDRLLIPPEEMEKVIEYALNELKLNEKGEEKCL